MTELVLEQVTKSFGGVTAVNALSLNVSQGHQTAYDIWDASLTYVEPRGRWRVSLWGKNLNDAAHRLSAVPTAGVLTQLYFAEPRTYGVELRVNLGQ